MTVTFERPVGAWADVEELEYISALHQTCTPDLRRDGSISAEDVKHFLSSRYGIRVTIEEVQETILKGLGGGDSEDECIDLTEVAAILLIPFLIKASRAQSESTRVMMQKSRNDFESEWQYQDYKRRVKIEEDRTLKEDIIQTVLDMILLDATGDTKPKALTKELIQQVFAAYGETDLVDRDDLLEEMIAAASSGEVDENGNPKEVLLDKDAFARALTMDVQKYDVSNESSISTHYFDVFHTYFSTKKSTKKSKIGALMSMEENKKANYASLPENDEEVPTDEIREVERIFTWPAIDYTADTYRSKVFYIVLWLCAILTYSSYMTSVDLAHFRMDCSEFICQAGNGVITWSVIMLQLCIFGTLFITCSSAGQSIYSSSIPASLFGMASVAFCTILPQYTEVETPLFDTTKDFFGGRTRQGSLITGCILLVLHFYHVLRLIIPNRFLSKDTMLGRFFTPSLAKAEYQTKQAASYKVNSFVKNAYDVHNYDEGTYGAVPQTNNSAYGRALLHFSKMRNTTEDAGGFLWTWKRILSGKLFTEEGVWLHSRIIAGNVAQILVCIFFRSLGLSHIFKGFSDDPERKLEDQIYYTDDASNYYTDDDGLGSLFSAVSMSALQYLPKQWVLVLSDNVAGMCAFLACLSIALVYIPSTVSTVLKIRCGVIRSLRDKKFLRLRKTEEQVTILYGSFFWGMLFTAVTVYGFSFLIVFLVAWNITRQFTVPLLATLCGLFVTVAFKTLVLTCLRSNFYSALYRKKPAQANLTIVVLECWNLGLTTGYMFARATKLIIASLLYLGRIDIPFISPEAGTIFGSELDAYPTAFLKDLVSHEAHRHPYLERLGVMYMMKLRYGDQFARTSGSVWRLLFVFALMPWMRKYRVMQQQENDGTGFKFGTFRMAYTPEKRYSHASPLPHGDDDESFHDAASSIKLTQLEYEIKDIKEENDALKQKVQELERKLKGSSEEEEIEMHFA